MSKCKSSLDGDKITEIRVIAKSLEGSSDDKSKEKVFDKSDNTSRTKSVAK